MNQEKAESKSPFAALTWQEQQDRWLAWRSKQLDYQPVTESVEAAPEKETASRAVSHPTAYDQSRPRLRIPNMQIAAPVRHQELDQVINRHKKALQQAGAFQTTAID